MEILLQPVVLIALAVALVAGFLFGRMGRDRRVDPSDFNHTSRAQAGRMSAQPISIPTTPRVDVAMPPEALAYLQQGKVINAIKALREAHPELGLREAKDAVEAFARKNGL